MRTGSMFMEPITRNAAACEADGCNMWTRNPEQLGFIEVVWADERSLYCSVGCMLRDVAKRVTPTRSPDGQG